MSDIDDSINARWKSTQLATSEPITAEVLDRVFADFVKSFERKDLEYQQKVEWYSKLSPEKQKFLHELGWDVEGDFISTDENLKWIREQWDNLP